MTGYRGIASAGALNFAKSLEPVAAENKASRLASFLVTTDSVVATAELVVEDSHEFVTIHWGDDQLDNIDLRKERLAHSGSGSANTLRIQHVYDEDMVLSTTVVVAVARDKQGAKSLEAHAIQVRPRYRFVHYPVIFEVGSHHDTFLETHSEFDLFLILEQKEQKIIDKHWNVSVRTGAGFSNTIPGMATLIPLDDSLFSFEMEVTDDPIRYDFFVNEDDGAVLGFLKGVWDFVTDIPADFDTSAPVLRFIHPDDFQGLQDYSVTYALDDGTLRAHFSMEMNLIVPRDRGSSGVVAPG